MGRLADFEMSSIEYEHGHFQSEYLCPKCGGLLYVDLHNPAFELCVNQSCERYPTDIQFSDLSAEGSPQLHQALSEVEAGLFAAIQQCDALALSLYAYEIRRELAYQALSHGIMSSISRWFAAGDLLLLLISHPPSGTETKQSLFDSIFNKTVQRVERLNFIEDIENERYKVLLSSKGQMTIMGMKYLSAVRDMQKDYGLTSSTALQDTCGLFQFQDIQELVTSDVDLRPGVDFSDFLDTLWPYILTLRYAFALYYRTSQQYSYSPHLVDIPVILGLLYSLPQMDTIVCSVGSIEKHFGRYEEYARGSRTFNQFLAEYVDNPQKIPIMVRVRDKIITDRATLLYFIIHLHGQYIGADEGPKVGGSRSVTRMKQQAADAFETKVREKVHSCGYTGPDKAVQVKFDYDILGVSEEKKRIIIADAKFRDLAPSSISGRTLIKQELLQPRQGLQAEAERHSQRTEHFRENLEAFRQYLNPQSSWDEYEIGSYLVTKHTPLVSQYKDIRIVSVADFLEYELSSSRGSK